MQTAPQVLELETTGTFTVVTDGDENGRCGLPGTPAVFQYRVVIVSSPEHLDEHGFVIDWQEVREFFRTAFQNVSRFPSCEIIACHAVTGLRALLGEERCHTVEVTVGSGLHPVGMKARWARG
jgi:hypothetical protein